MSDVAELAIKPPPPMGADNLPPPAITTRRPSGNDLAGILTWLEPRLLEAHPRATPMMVRGWLLQCISDNQTFFRWDPATNVVVLASIFQEPMGEPYAMGRFAVAKDGQAVQREILAVCAEMAQWLRRMRLRAIVMPALADVGTSDFKRAIGAEGQETRRQTALFIPDQVNPFSKV